MTAELGRGAFGTVFKASRKGDGQIFAIKKIKGDASKVQSEIKCCMKLSENENVVRYYGRVEGSGYADNVYWLILEYCNLGTLSNYILSYDSDNKTLLEFSENMANGLKFLHKNRVIHRDLKTDNVLVTTNRKGSPICKISDFGLARCIVDLPGFYLSSHVGIPYFTAPEVWAGRYTESADVYSLGLILLAIFTRSKLQGKDKFVLIPYIDVNKTHQPIGTAINFGRESDVRAMIKTHFKYFDRLGNLIIEMIHKEPSVRPKAPVVCDEIKNIKVGESSKTLKNALASALTIAKCVDDLFRPLEIEFAGARVIKETDSGVGDINSPFIFDVNSDFQ